MYVYVCTYILDETKRVNRKIIWIRWNDRISRILGKKTVGLCTRRIKLIEPRKEKIVAHGPSTSVVERKTQVFLFRLSFVRPCTRYRTTELPYVFPNIGLPWLNASRPTSSCHDSFRLDTSVSRYNAPCIIPHRPSFPILPLFLLTRSLRLLSPPNCSTVLRTNDETNRFRYLYPFSHLDILFSYSTPCIVNDKFAILKNTLSERR